MSFELRARNQWDPCVSHNGPFEKRTVIVQRETRSRIRTRPCRGTASALSLVARNRSTRASIIYPTTATPVHATGALEIIDGMNSETGIRDREHGEREKWSTIEEKWFYYEIQFLMYTRCVRRVDVDGETCRGLFTEFRRSEELARYTLVHRRRDERRSLDRARWNSKSDARDETCATRVISISNHE